ncbi:MAG: hypothetical protein K9H49_02660 [Bacteroidales bacterium]|nr:hypothetical protein [Bacteroidales bacterium]MCF8389159.1 hypothetical protein [Bacteroidales bacterium]
MAKIEFMRFPFKGAGGGSMLQNIISKELPELYNIIKAEKKRTNLSVMLQRIESSIFIPVQHKFVNEGCLSVHESLYFRDDLAVRVQNELKEQFQVTGFDNFKLNKIFFNYIILYFFSIPYM